MASVLHRLISNDALLLWLYFNLAIRKQDELKYSENCHFCMHLWSACIWAAALSAVTEHPYLLNAALAQKLLQNYKANKKHEMK
jgi:hypothetical protein